MCAYVCTVKPCVRQYGCDDLLCVAGTVEFLRKLELDNDSLTKSIIGTIGDVDSYQLPDSKGRTAFMRHILSISDAERQERREQILGTSLKDFR